MRYQALLPLVFASGVVVVAQDYAGYESAVISYIQSFIQNPSIEQLFATAPPNLLASFAAIPATALINGDYTPNFSAIPQPYGSILASVYTRELGFASQYGVYTFQPGQTAFGGPTATDSAGSIMTGSTAVATNSAAGFTNSANPASGQASNSAAGNTPSSTSTKNVASKPTGIAILGLAAGVIGGVAALL